MPSDDLSRLYDFVAGTTIVADQVDAELNQLINTINIKVGRGTTETISGVKTFSAANSHTGNNTFSGQNTFSDATSPILTDRLSERTSNNGILIDGCLIQDGNVRLGTTRATVTLASGVNTTTDVLTTDATHGLTTADPIRLRATSGSTLPTGTSASTQYYARVLTTTTITLHPTVADANANTNRVDITDVGSGTLWIIGDEASPNDGDLWYNDGFKGRHLGNTITLLNNRSAGCILQVVQTTKTNTYTQNSTTYTDVTGMSVTITPASATNTILVRAVLQVACNTATILQAQLLRGSTVIGVGDTAGSRVRAGGASFTGGTSEMQTMVLEWLDSPATTAATSYKIQFRGALAGNVYLNRTDSDVDAANSTRTASTITAMEVIA
jgi:hypothetical protein